MDDSDSNRKHRRSRAFKEGQIVFNSGSSLIDCVIRDRSESGARLRVPAATVLPDSFSLLVISEGRMYPSEIRWRIGEEVGLLFVGPSTPAPPRVR